MHEELVEWATVAYRSNPNATDADVEEVLVHHGFGRRLAWRATAMLPLAFGRLVLKGLVTLPSTYLEGGIEYELEADPVFVAATARASHAGRDDLERIGLRSAEVNAVNAALNAGSKAENLLLSSPVLMDPTSGADADAPGPRDRAQRMVDELRSAHGSALACHARLFPSKLTTTVVQLQVDFDTASPRLGERFVRESFAGYATRCSPHSVAPACTTATRARRSVARQRTRPRVAQRNRCRMARRLERGRRRPQHPLHRRLLHRRPLQSRRRSLRSRAFGVTIVRFAPHSFCC